MIGLALLALGAVALWAAFTGRAESVLSALAMQLPAIGAGNRIVSGTTDGALASSSSSSSDSGEHSALTDGGLVYTIKKAYADMTDDEQHDANNYAHNQENLGSG